MATLLNRVESTGRANSCRKSRMRIWVAVAILTGTFLGLGWHPAGATVIGATKSVVRLVEGITNTSVRRLEVNDDVYQDERIRTAAESATLLAFPDQTEFMVGPDSEVTLDTFIYDPNPDKGKLFLRMKRGLLKFRTGTMASQAYKVQSRVATIGVRGTEFAVHVAGDGTTIVYVMAGVVIVTDNFGRTIELHASESTIIYPEGADRAGGGPVRFATVDPAFRDEVRWLVALLLYDPTGFHNRGSLQGIPTPRGRPNGLPAMARPNPPGDRGNDGNGRMGRGVPGSGFAGGGFPGGGISGGMDDGGTPSRSGGGNTGSGGTGGANSGGGADTGGGPSNPPEPPGGPQVSNDGFLLNGDFQAGALFWGASAPGRFDVIAMPGDPSAPNLMAELATGSPISLSNTLTRTPDHVFRILFDAEFVSGSGILDVLLDDLIIATFLPDSVTDGLPLAIEVLDPRFGGLSNVDLTFRFDAPEPGQKLLIDNVTIVDTGAAFPDRATIVAQPLPLALLMAPGTVLAYGLWRRRAA